MYGHNVLLLKLVAKRLSGSKCRGEERGRKSLARGNDERTECSESSENRFCLAREKALGTNMYMGGKVSNFYYK